MKDARQKLESPSISGEGKKYESVKLTRPRTFHAARVFLSRLVKTRACACKIYLCGDCKDFKIYKLHRKRIMLKAFTRKYVDIRKFFILTDLSFRLTRVQL